MAFKRAVDNIVPLPIGKKIATSGEFKAKDIKIIDDTDTSKDLLFDLSGSPGNSTIRLPEAMIKNISYIIYKDGSNTKAINGNTSVVDYSDAISGNTATVLNDVADALSSGMIFFRKGTYTIESDVDMGDNIYLRGEGRHATRFSFGSSGTLRVGTTVFYQRTDLKTFTSDYIKNIQIDGYYQRTENDRLTDLEDDVGALFQRQSIPILYKIWAAGQYTMLNGGKHTRLKISDASVTINDNSDQEQSIEIVGITNTKEIATSYGAGVSIPLDILRDTIGFNEQIDVVATGNRRVTVELICESDE